MGQWANWGQSGRLWLLIVGMLWAGGCSLLTRPAHAPAETVTPPAPNQAILLIPEAPPTLNPYLSLAPIVRQVADATLGALVTVDAAGHYAPVLAAELPTLENGGVSEDFLTITWRLRPDLRWSDGAPLTSDDLKFTWEAVSHPDSGAVLLAGFDLIERIETPDARTAVVTYRELNLAYLQQFMAGLLPRHATGAPEAMLEWRWNRAPVSAGPFVVLAWPQEDAAGQEIVMVRNPHYFRAGQPYLDRLIFAVEPDSGTQLARMAAGEAHVQLWPGVAKPLYDAQVGEMAELREAPGLWNMALRFNLSRPDDGDPGATPPHPILGDARVRQALALAIDYGRIVQEVNPGTLPATGPFAAGWYACERPRLYPYDPERAASLLTAAGWTEGPDGVRVAAGARTAEDGTRLALRLAGYADFQPLVALQDALVEMWSAVGVEVTVENAPLDTFFGPYENAAPRKLGDFDLLLYDTSLPLEPQAAVMNSYHSGAIPSAEDPAGSNVTRWVNPAADAAIVRAGSTLDLPARRAAYCDLAELIAADLPQVHLYRFPEGIGVANGLAGVQVNVWTSITWDVEDWRLK